MRNNTSSPATALSNTVAAWNSKAREISAPALRHVVSAISSLQQLDACIRQVDETHGAFLIPDSEGALDHANTLEGLCSRLQRLQESLAHLNEDLLAAASEGESLADAFLALPRHDAPPGARTLHPSPTGDSNEDANQIPDANSEARNGNVESLSGLLSAAEQRLKSPAGTSRSATTRSVSQIELQSVQEFVQNSPLASIPVNASYYERILEAANSPEGHKVPMGKILTAAGIVTERQLQIALDYQRTGRRRALGNVLVEMGYTTEEAIAQAVAAQLALPYVVLANEPIDSSAVSIVPVHMARRHDCFPVNYTGHALCVAMVNPLDLIALDDLRIASRNHIRPCVATRTDIVRHIERYYA